MLDFNIYGLRVRIIFSCREEESEVADLLKFFLSEQLDGIDLTLSFKKKEFAREIGGLIYPGLAKMGIWAIHSGGFDFKGGRLVIGPSNSGKSTLSFIAFKYGLSIISDDITLLRQTDRGIELLPFYARIFLRDRSVIPEPEIYRPAILSSFLLPHYTSGANSLKRVKKRSDLMRKLAPQMLWSLDRNEQKRQKVFLEALCRYRAFEVQWGPELHDDNSLFKALLDEIV